MKLDSLMHRVRPLFLAAVVACSSKSASPEPKLDCHAYAARYAELVQPDPSRRDTVYQGAERSCVRERVNVEQYTCVVEKAKTENELRACLGMPPVGQ